MLLSRILCFTRSLTVRKQITTKTPAYFYENQDFQQKRGYKNFGHKREITPLVSKCFTIFILTFFILSFVDWRWCRMLYLNYTGQLEDKSKEKAYHRQLECQ